MKILPKAATKLQKITNRVEPWSIMITYFTLLWCAYFAWFYPPLPALQIFTPVDHVAQAMLFTIGGTLSIVGHLTDRIFIEELGLISGTMAIVLYTYVVFEYMVLQNRLTVLGEILGVLLIAMFLLMNRAFKVHEILSARWLKPTQKHVVEGS